jgi:moderate conductance mechanosensitive channel
MSSFLSEIPWLSVSNLLRLAGIIVAALLINQLLRRLTQSMVKPAATQTRAAQSREQQTRSVAAALYSVASKVVWVLALLMALQEFGFNVFPLVIIGGAAVLALGFGARNVVRDAVSGMYIVLEDQFAIGDSIQIGETIGRVEHLSLRRTVVRDARGALVTFANGDIRSVGNLSRDWSQIVVDVAVSPEIPQERTMQALDAAAAELRNDAAWSQALVDGPRILGLQSYDQNVSTIRLQMRTAPSRHEDVARELRRRIQIEFQRQGIALSNVQRVELVDARELKSPRSPVSSA